VFEIDIDELPIFYERELEFRWVFVRPFNLDDTPMESDGIMCARFSDEEFRRERCNDEKFFDLYGRWGITKIWEDNLYPCRLYLRHCILAAKKLGVLAEESFLDNTYLGDRRTTIREYILANPSLAFFFPYFYLSRFGVRAARSSLEVFLDSIGSPTTPLRDRHRISRSSSKTADRIYLDRPLHPYPWTTIATDRLPSCVTPSLDYYQIGSHAPPHALAPKGPIRKVSGG